MMERKWSERSLKNLKGIHPDLRRVMDRALQESPVDFIVIEGLRTKERQKELFDQGFSKTMNSRHLTGHAVDIWPVDPDTGKAANGRDGKRMWELYRQIAPAVKEAADDLDVEIVWGGDWRKFKDGPHFELDRDFYPVGAAPKERTKPIQSTTVQASAVQIASGAGAGVAAVGALDGTAQIVALAIAGLVVLTAAWIMRERLRKWAEGVR